MADARTCPVFVTGFTGLIGGEVAQEFAAKGHKVFVLIRARTGEEVQRRLVERFARSGKAVDERVIPVCGDVTLPVFGLCEADRSRIAGECRLIVHCAADTSLRMDADAERTNGTGVRNLVQFAKAFRALVRVVFVSTASVNTGPENSVLREDDVPRGYVNPYVASKRNAERLLERSGLPCVVVRPSIVLSRGLPDRKFARAILWALPLVIERGGLAVESAARLDIVSVHFVAEAIVVLALRESLRHTCYHVSSGVDKAVSCRAISDALLSAGRIRAPLRFGRDAGYAKSPVNAYVPFIDADVVYDNRRLHEELRKDFPQCAPFTQYCDSMLNLVDREEAVGEAVNP